MCTPEIEESSLWRMIGPDDRPSASGFCFFPPESPESIIDHHDIPCSIHIVTRNGDETMRHSGTRIPLNQSHLNWPSFHTSSAGLPRPPRAEPSPGPRRRRCHGDGEETRQRRPKGSSSQPQTEGGEAKNIGHRRGGEEKESSFDLQQPIKGCE